MKPARVLMSLALLALGCGESAGPELEPIAFAQPPAIEAEAAALGLADTSPWASRQACEAALAARGPRTATAPSVATWNIRWFPDGRAGSPREGGGTDVEWLACTLALLDVDVLAVQELVTGPRGRAALLDLVERLGALTGGEWRFYLDECPDDGRQHVGFLWNSARVAVADARTVPEINPGRGACFHRLRPGVAARMRFAGGVVFDALVVHLDSGTEARDRGNRRTSVRRIAEVFEGVAPVVVLGDFNTMGCRRCDPREDGAEELVATVAQLEPAGIERASPDHACSEHYRGRAVLLDHVFTRGLPGARLETHGVCGELACARLPRDAAAYERLSDHCPLVLRLE